MQAVLLVIFRRLEHSSYQLLVEPHRHNGSTRTLNIIDHYELFVDFMDGPAIFARVKQSNSSQVSPSDPPDIETYTEALILLCQPSVETVT